MTPHLRASAQFSASLPKAFAVSSPQQLRGRLEAVEPRAPIGYGLRQALATAVLLSLLIAPVAIVELTNGWPLDTTLRHFAAAAGCTAARAVKLAPARAGEPGYWPWLDRNGSGISCLPS